MGRAEFGALISARERAVWLARNKVGEESRAIECESHGDNFILRARVAIRNARRLFFLSGCVQRARLSSVVVVVVVVVVNQQDVRSSRLVSSGSQ